MSDPTVPVAGASAVARLHLALTAGLAAILGMFPLLFRLGSAPILPADGRPEWLGTVLGGLGLVPITLAFAIFRARVPYRTGRQSAEEYWRVRERVGAALLFWVLIEGGGTIGAIGMLVTGSLLSGAVSALALATLVLNGPGRLGGPARIRMSRDAAIVPAR